VKKLAPIQSIVKFRFRKTRQRHKNKKRYFSLQEGSHNSTFRMAHDLDGETVRQSLLNALFTELTEGKDGLATAMESIGTNANNTYAVRLRVFDDIPPLIRYYKEKKCVLRNVHRVSICGVRAYLLGMEHSTNVANKTTCVVGAAFGIRVLGHCLLIDKEWVLKKMKKELLFHGCATCGKEKAILKCASCRCSYYCNQKCQRADWPNHKKTHFYIDVSCPM